MQVPIANITLDSPDSFKANVEFLEGHTLESVLPGQQNCHVALIVCATYVWQWSYFIVQLLYYYKFCI